jgi:hypothetical protein
LEILTGELPRNAVDNPVAEKELDKFVNIFDLQPESAAKIQIFCETSGRINALSPAAVPERGYGQGWY